MFLKNLPNTDLAQYVSLDEGAFCCQLEASSFSAPVKASWVTLYRGEAMVIVPQKEEMLDEGMCR